MSVKCNLSVLVVACLVNLLPAQLVAQEIPIYNISSFEYGSNQPRAIIYLSDRYRYPAHPDSAVIPDRLTGEVPVNDGNHHELSPIHREKFLQQMAIREDDKVFIYSFERDSISTFSVNDLKLVAHVSIYTHRPPLEDYYYKIGFIVPGYLREGENFYDNTLVAIGDDCPFVDGKAEPMIWTETDRDVFQNHTPTLLNGYEEATAGKVYRYTNDAYEFFIQNRLIDEHPMARCLLVLDSSTGEVVFENVYYDRESTFLIGLNRTNGMEADWDAQYTGKVLKDRPAIVKGFLGNSFGCAQIDFLDQEIEPIVIRCDNRH